MREREGEREKRQRDFRSERRKVVYDRNVVEQRRLYRAKKKKNGKEITDK